MSSPIHLTTNLSSSPQHSGEPSPITNGSGPPSSEDVSSTYESIMTRSQALNLYTTHFLSTWNVRTYEFAAIIFTASAYPDTLTAASIRGIIRTLASICLSSIVGRWVDQSPNRLTTLLHTITINRISVISCSILWFFIVSSEVLSSPSYQYLLKASLFTLVCLLGILENLSASGNMLSMERDWILVAASTDGKAYDLTQLNAAMRRIDLICKLVAPILISVVVSSLGVRIGVVIVGGTSVVSWGLEMWCARRVWDSNPQLKESKNVDRSDESSSNLEISHLETLFRGLRTYVQDFSSYFSSTVWIPSISLAFLHISALTYSATFITYLLAMGLSLDLITIARAAGGLVEISSTVITPFGVHLLSKARSHDRLQGQNTTEAEEALLDEGAEMPLERKTEVGLERLGLWGIVFQFASLVPVLLSIYNLSSNSPNSPFSPQVLTLLTFLSLSRLGLWIFDLTTQQLTQTLVPQSKRSSFTSIEYSFASLFELIQYVVTIILSRPQDFVYIAGASWVAVGISACAYAGWVRRERGHLVHWEKLGKGCGVETFRSGEACEWVRRRGRGWF